MNDTIATNGKAGFTPSTEVDEVLAYLSGTLSRLERMFVDGCARAAEHIAARQWKRFDPNLYAHEVRKEVFEALLQEGLAVELEDSDPLQS